MAETEPENLDQFADELIAERRADLSELPADMAPWMAKSIYRIDTMSLWIGRVVCWLIVPMLFVMVYEVVARKIWVAPTMWAYDLSRFFYGALFMLGAGYALSKGVHIRADFIYRNWPPRVQGAIDTILYVLLYFPGLIACLYTSTDFALASIIRQEKGMDTAWMPIMWPIKSALPIGILLLLIQGFSELLKSIYAMRNNKWPL